MMPSIPSFFMAEQSLIISVSSLHFYFILNKFGISALHNIIFRLTHLEAVVLSFNDKQTEYIFIT